MREYKLVLCYQQINTWHLFGILTPVSRRKLKDSLSLKREKRNKRRKGYYHLQYRKYFIINRPLSTRGCSWNVPIYVGYARFLNNKYKLIIN